MAKPPLIFSNWKSNWMTSLLRNLIAQFAQGIDKVEITMEDIRKQLSRPLTPQEAIDTLISYIDGLCIGKERNKVRIIIK